MCELTISITVQLPDNRDEVNKILTLLTRAREAAGKNATEYIGDLDHDYAVLNSALPHPRPAEYNKLVADLYNKSTQWRNASELAQAILWNSFGIIFNAIHSEEGAAHADQP